MSSWSDLKTRQCTFAGPCFCTLLNGRSPFPLTLPQCIASWPHRGIVTTSRKARNDSCIVLEARRHQSRQAAVGPALLLNRRSILVVIIGTSDIPNMREVTEGVLGSFGRDHLPSQENLTKHTCLFCHVLTVISMCPCLGVKIHAKATCCSLFPLVRLSMRA